MTFANADKFLADDTFEADLFESNEDVWLIARWLQQRGKTVKVVGLRFRPTVEQMAEYSDKLDIAVEIAVEVKRRRNLTFTCANDYPYDTVFVDVAHKIDRSPARYYFILNREATHVAFIDGTLRGKWLLQKRYDSGKGRERKFYTCPKELVRFFPIGGADVASDG